MANEKATPVVVVDGYDIVESYRNGDLQATPVVVVSGGGGGTSDVDKAYVDSQDALLQSNIDLKADISYVDTQDQVLSYSIDNVANEMTSKLDIGQYENEKTKTLLNASKAISATINAGQVNNLLQYFIIGDFTTLGKQGFSLAGTGVNTLLKFPTNTNFVNYSIQLTFNGTIAGSTGTPREFKVQINRPSPTTLIRSAGIVKVDNNSLNDRSNPVILTYTNGTNDAFITNGIKLELNNTTTQTITLTNCQIMVQGN